MAARYWVGGNGTWSTTAGSNWSLTSGGAGGQATPSALDDVFLDNGTGHGNVTIGTAYTALCKSLTCTGYTGVIGGSGNITVSGAVLFASTMGTITCTGVLTFGATANQTSAGKNWSGKIGLASFTTTLLDDWTCTDYLQLAGTGICNGFTISSSTGISGSSNTSGTTTFKIVGVNGFLVNTVGTLKNNVTVDLTGVFTLNAATTLYGTGILWLKNFASMVSTGSTLTLNSSPTVQIDVAGANFNIISCISAAFTFNGTNGFTCSQFTGGSAGQTYSLKDGNTYTITSSLSNTVSATGTRSTFTSSHATNVAYLVLQHGASQDNSFLNGTRIDSSGGKTIATYKGTLTTTTNWALLPTSVQSKGSIG